MIGDDRVPRDLLGAATWAAATLAVVATGIPGTPYVRVPLAVGFLAVVPGVLVTLVVFPRREDLDGVERAVFAVASSVATVVLLGVVLNAVWRIDAFTVTVAAVAVSGALAVAVAWLRGRLGEDAARPASSALDGLRERWSHVEPTATTPRIAVAAGALAVVVAVAVVLFTPAPGETFTALAVYGPDGTVDGLRNVTDGDTDTVTIVVENHEKARARYEVVVRTHPGPGETREPRVVSRYDGIRLADGGTWTCSVTLPVEDGERPDVAVALHRDGRGPSPYRETVIRRAGTGSNQTGV